MYMILHDNNNIIVVPDISNPYLNRGGIRNDKKCIVFYRTEKDAHAGSSLARRWISVLQINDVVQARK